MAKCLGGRIKLPCNLLLYLPETWLQTLSPKWLLQLLPLCLHPSQQEEGNRKGMCLSRSWPEHCIYHCSSHSDGLSHHMATSSYKGRWQMWSWVQWPYSQLVLGMLANKEREVFCVSMEGGGLAHLCSVAQSCLSLRPHGLQQTRLSCPLPSLEFAQTHAHWVGNILSLPFLIIHSTSEFIYFCIENHIEIRRINTLYVLVVNNLPASAGDMRREFEPWVRKVPCRRAWQPTPIFLL